VVVVVVVVMVVARFWWWWSGLGGVVETDILGGIEVRPVQGEVVGVGGVRCAEPAPSTAGPVSSGVGAVNGARIGGAGQVNVVKSAIGPAAAPDMVTRLSTLDVLGGDGGWDVGSCGGHGGSSFLVVVVRTSQRCAMQ
jgi:hypothetical protein